MKKIYVCRNINEFDFITKFYNMDEDEKIFVNFNENPIYYLYFEDEKYSGYDLVIGYEDWEEDYYDFQLVEASVEIRKWKLKQLYEHGKE